MLTIPFLGYREASDGKFTTARELVPQCLDLCDVLTIRRFFRKCWRYMDSYRWVFFHIHNDNTLSSFSGNLNTVKVLTLTKLHGQSKHISHTVGFLKLKKSAKLWKLSRAARRPLDPYRLFSDVIRSCTYFFPIFSAFFSLMFQIPGDTNFHFSIQSKLSNKNDS